MKPNNQVVKENLTTNPKTTKSNQWRDNLINLLIGMKLSKKEKLEIDRFISTLLQQQTIELDAKIAFLSLKYDPVAIQACRDVIRGLIKNL